MLIRFVDDRINTYVADITKSIMLLMRRFVYSVQKIHNVADIAIMIYMYSR